MGKTEAKHIMSYDEEQSLKKIEEAERRFFRRLDNGPRRKKISSKPKRM